MLCSDCSKCTFPNQERIEAECYCKYDVGSHHGSEAIEVDSDFRLTTTEIIKRLDSTELWSPHQKFMCERGWTLAMPAPPIVFQEAKAMSERGQAAVIELRNTIANPQGARAASFVFVGCAGIGKSRSCDEAQRIFFPGQPSILIKVSYCDRSEFDRYNFSEAFLWRIVAGIYGTVNPKFTLAHVAPFLDNMNAPRVEEPLTFERVVAFATEMLPNDQPWILAVDELVKLPMSDENKSQILALCSNWVKLSIGSPFLRCVALASFAPDFIACPSLPPIFLPPSLLHVESALAMAVEFGLDPVNNPLVMSAILVGAGHPRALWLGLNHLKEHGTLITSTALAPNLRAGAMCLSEIPELMQHSFAPQEWSDLSKSLRDNVGLGTVRFAPVKGAGLRGWLSTPVALLASEFVHSFEVTRKRAPNCQVGNLTQQASSSSSSSSSSLASNSEKQFEECICQFDLLKKACGLGVVPPMLHVTLPSSSPSSSSHSGQSPRRKAPRLLKTREDWDELQYDFNGQFNEDVLKLVKTESKEEEEEEGGNEEVEILEDFKSDISLPLHVCCEQVNHPYFDAMYDAKFPSDGARVKVLLRCTLSDRLTRTIAGLEAAAELLRDSGGWAGEFLFVVVVAATIGKEEEKEEEEAKKGMEAVVVTAEEEEDEGCAYPLLLVQRKDYELFFSPTFAPIVELQCAKRRQLELKNKRACNGPVLN